MFGVQEKNRNLKRAVNRNRHPAKKCFHFSVCIVYILRRIPDFQNFEFIQPVFRTYQKLAGLL